MSAESLRLANMMIDDPAKADAMAKRIRERARAAKARRRVKAAPRVAAKTEVGGEDPAYTLAKKTAAVRASSGTFTESASVVPRCEYRDGSYRCAFAADDPDHVLGGAYRRECERLGAEGLMLLCRQHHDQKHANTPTRGFWLAVAAAHAAIYGYGRLTTLIDKAQARYDAKHPRAQHPERTP